MRKGGEGEEGGKTGIGKKKNLYTLKEFFEGENKTSHYLSYLGEGGDHSPAVLKG